MWNHSSWYKKRNMLPSRWRSQAKMMALNNNGRFLNSCLTFICLTSHIHVTFLLTFSRWYSPVFCFTSLNAIHIPVNIHHAIHVSSCQDPMVPLICKQSIYTTSQGAFQLSAEIGVNCLSTINQDVILHPGLSLYVAQLQSCLSPTDQWTCTLTLGRDWDVQLRRTIEWRIMGGSLQPGREICLSVSTWSKFECL